MHKLFVINGHTFSKELGLHLLNWHTLKSLNISGVEGSTGLLFPHKKIKCLSSRLLTFLYSRIYLTFKTVIVVKNYNTQQIVTVTCRSLFFLDRFTYL